MLQDEIIKRNRETIEAIELTPEEIETALFLGKKMKYFWLKNQEYWQSLELKKSGRSPSNIRKG